MIISSVRKLAYFHIPKTAGNSIKNLLFDACPDARHIQLQLAMAKNVSYENRYNSLYHKSATYSQHTFQIPVKQALDIMGLRVSNFFEFVIVRNPYDRILSQYNYHIQITRENLDFDLFLNKFVADNDDTTFRSNNWFSSQIRWINNPLTNKLHIFKYESLDSAWTTIRQRLNIDLPDLPRKNVTRNKTLEFLNADQKAKCYDLFKDEFEHLGYER